MFRQPATIDDEDYSLFTHSGDGSHDGQPLVEGSGDNFVFFVAEFHHYRRLLHTAAAIANTRSSGQFG